MVYSGGVRSVGVPVCSNDSSCGILSTPWYWSRRDFGVPVCSNDASCRISILFAEFHKRGTDAFPNLVCKTSVHRRSSECCCDNRRGCCG